MERFSEAKWEKFVENEEDQVTDFARKWFVEYEKWEYWRILIDFFLPNWLNIVWNFLKNREFMTWIFCDYTAEIFPQNFPILLYFLLNTTHIPFHIWKYLPNIKKNHLQVKKLTSIKTEKCRFKWLELKTS